MTALRQSFSIPPNICTILSVFYIWVCGQLQEGRRPTRGLPHGFTYRTYAVPHVNAVLPALARYFLFHLLFDFALAERKNKQQ